MTKYSSLLLLAGMCIGFVSGLFLVHGQAEYRTERDTLTYTDTIAYYKPVMRDSTVIRYVTRTLPVSRPAGNRTSSAEIRTSSAGNRTSSAEIRTSSAENRTSSAEIRTSSAGNYAQNDGDFIPPQEMPDDSGTIAVEIPITQKVYEGDDYRAWVSGYEPSLDSILVFAKTTVVTERVYKPRRWHIGFTGGIGFAGGRTEPFIGIGITYSIISF